ncbi:OmpP1/FadL family transporter [Spirosoma rigui]|uniref:OmpP1/FadL family transporter n=1 Tax=Spirosoma rigui TaxID=564064 RepID=UPI0009B17DC1|nr:outer membrane protein transport protein [Spirosoma rigui]
MNRRIVLTAGLLTTAVVSYGQYAGDAFRYSDQTTNGTARFQGLGGNHAALGGDASNAFGNPAGLGFYNRSELSITPSFRLTDVQANFLGQNTTAKQTQASVGQASLIFAGNPRNSTRVRRTTFGITYSQQANFANQFILRGTNNRSSLADSYVASVNSFNVPSGQLDQDYTPPSGNLTVGTAGSLEAAAYQLYLVNPTQDNGTQYFRYDRGIPAAQQVSYQSSGAQSQWGLSYAGNLDDKLYLGGTLNFTRTRFDFTQVFSESYLGGRVFRGFDETSSYTVKGNGVGLTIGTIYKPDPNLQVGVTLTSPTFTSYKETYNQSLSIDPIGIPQANGSFLIPDTRRVDVDPNDFDFRITSPFRASGGLTYLFGTSGFLTGTVEYVGYSGMRVNTSYSQNAADNQAFREDNTLEIQQTYKNTVNVRVGGEIRAGLFRARAGLAYLPSAYKQNLDGLTAADRQRLVYSAGIGVRNTRFFADISGAVTSFKTAYTPYTLNDPRDYGSGLLSNNNTNIALSFGVFF